MTKHLRLDIVDTKVRYCTSCSNCFDREFSATLGNGDVDADVMILCAFPSRQDENDQKIYSPDSPRGISLGKVFEKLGVKRSDFYITSMSKCPSDSENEDSFASCSYFLRKQLTIINPKIVISLDDRVSKFLCGEDFKHGDLCQYEFDWTNFGKNGEEDVKVRKSYGIIPCTNIEEIMVSKNKDEARLLMNIFHNVIAETSATV